MFSYVVADPDMNDEYGNPSKEAGIYMDAEGKMYALCNTKLAQRVIDGYFGMFQVKLEAIDKDEWEKADHRFVSKSEGEKIAATGGTEGI